MEGTKESGLVTSAVEERLGSFLSLRGIVALAAVAGIAVALVLILAGARGVDPDTAVRELEIVPLSEHEIAYWIEGASELARARAEAGAPLTMDTVRAFAQWGKADPEAIGPSMKEMVTPQFLSVTFAIDEARRNAQALSDHKVRMEAFEARAGLMDQSFAGAAPPPAPDLTAAQEADLIVYRTWQDAIEGAMRELLPSLRSPGPSEAVPAPAGTAPASRPIQWRVVNRSRYGPKVIRER
ncbi:MAG: hypothetical protein ACYTFG_05375 [Planctomycetota bacterium]